jgi:hypothetical protein
MTWANLDAGLLVACLCPRNEHQAWVRQALEQIYPESRVGEAILAETCHLAPK